MPESLVLPAATGPTTGLWRVRSLFMSRSLSSSGGPVVADPEGAEITVALQGENGRDFVYTWRGAAADADIVALNKVNLTSNTLQKRILNKLIADGVFVGTVSGTPD